jgi:hypothetical protein
MKMFRFLATDLSTHTHTHKKKKIYIYLSWMMSGELFYPGFIKAEYRIQIHEKKNSFQEKR